MTRTGVNAASSGNVLNTHRNALELTQWQPMWGTRTCRAHKTYLSWAATSRHFLPAALRKTRLPRDHSQRNTASSSQFVRGFIIRFKRKCAAAPSRGEGPNFQHVATQDLSLSLKGFRHSLCSTACETHYLHRNNARKFIIFTALEISHFLSKGKSNNFVMIWPELQLSCRSWKTSCIYCLLPWAAHISLCISAACLFPKTESKAEALSTQSQLSSG